jgi:hypothetical protein
MKHNLEKRERRKHVLAILSWHGFALADYVKYQQENYFTKREEITEQLLEGGFLDEEIDAAFISIKPVERSGDHDSDKD